MTTMTCKECSKEFEPESFGEWGSFCPYCATEVREAPQDESVSELSHNENGSNALCSKCSTDLKIVEKTHTLDSKTYCHACIEAAGLAEFLDEGFRLEETVKFRFGQRLRNKISASFYYSAMFGFLVAGFELIIKVALHAGGQKGALGAADLTVTFGIFIIIWMFSFFFITPFWILSTLWVSREKICVMDGLLIVQRPSSNNIYSFDRCQWTVTKSRLNRFNLMPFSSSFILIKHPEKKTVVCGYSERTLKLWKGFFELIELPKFKHIGFFAYCKNLIASIDLCGVIGLGIGYAFRLFTGNPDWISAWVFMGFLDGYLIHVSYRSWIQKTEEYLREYFNQSVLIIYYGTIAVLSAGFGSFDLDFLLVLGTVNLLVAFIQAWIIRRKAKENSAITSSNCYWASEDLVKPADDSAMIDDHREIPL